MRTRYAALLLSLALWGCGTTGSAIPPPKARKWEGPWMQTPDGGRIRKTLYYGPWQCRQVWLDECESKCAAQKLTSMGCIWLADIKTELQKTIGILPMEMGGRLAVTHCCCDYPPASDLEDRRTHYENQLNVPINNTTFMTSDRPEADFSAPAMSWRLYLHIDIGTFN